MEANVARKPFFGKETVLTLLFFTSLAAASSAGAYESPVNRKQSERARNMTVEAVKLIEKGKWEEARQKIAQSKDPLATKIFYWMRLMRADRKDWSNDDFIRLSSFISKNPEWPDILKMTLRAEGIMPEELSNEEVIAWYQKFEPQTPYGMGRYMDALIINGEYDKARTVLAQWWEETLTSGNSQQKIFQKYGGYLTLDAHKRRFNALLHEKHYESAMDIAHVLGQGYPQLAKARIALSKNKGSGVGELIDAVPSYLSEDPGLLYERLKWRRKRGLDSGASDILLMDINAENVRNRKDWWKERHIIIRRLLESGQHEKAYKISAKHMQKEGFSYAQAQWLTGWLALRFMNRPTDAYERFSALAGKVSTPVSKSRAGYWAGRAAYAMGQRDLSRKWYKDASQYKTVFYGQMAGAALSRGGELPKSKLPHITASDYKNFEKKELFQAFEVFKQANKTRHAEKFMSAFLKANETPKSYRFAAEKLAQNNDFYNAVKVAKKASRKGLFLTKQSYPTITKHLQDIHSAEWALIHALIRQESMFDYNAKSSAGARGLMQIMPSTAKYLSKKMNVSYNKAWLTDNPKYNLHLGAYYIGELIERYDGHYPLAIAAYNAGPGRVDKWLKLFGDPRKNEIGILDWLELIPIYETRNYVQRVLENTYVYRLRLKDIQLHTEKQLHVAFHPEP